MLSLRVMSEFEVLLQLRSTTLSHVDDHGPCCHRVGAGERYRSEGSRQSPEAIVMPGFLLSLRAMSRFEVLLQLGSVLVSMVSVTNESHADVCGLCICWMPY